MRSFTAFIFLTLTSAIMFAQVEAENFTFSDVLVEAGKILEDLDPDLAICKVDCYPLGRPGRAVPYQQLTNITFTARTSNDSFYTITATATHGFGNLQPYDATDAEIKSVIPLNGSLSLDIGPAADRIKPNGSFSHASILQLNFTSQGTVTPIPVWRFYIGNPTTFGQEQCTIPMDESSESCVA